ncbi:MAG: ASCH domain-containing protein [Chloroflexi bacterium]|nr:ASCH domain-containing protein [Chloroflexota bacterium]
MKALTLTQPWATLVAIGAKTIETRSWMTNYTGPLAIHAAKTFPRWAQDTCFIEPFFSTLRSYYAVLGLTDNYGKDILKLLPLGQIVAIGELVSIRHVESVDPPEPERSFGDYSPGRHAWMLQNVRPVMPMPARGTLGLWEFDLPTATPARKKLPEPTSAMQSATHYLHRPACLIRSWRR